MSDETEEAAGLSPGNDVGEVWRKYGRKERRQYRIILVRTRQKEIKGLFEEGTSLGSAFFTFEREIIDHASQQWYNDENKSEFMEY